MPPIFVTGLPDTLDDLSPDGIDSISTDGIDILAAASLQGAPELVDLSLGSRQMTSAYVGPDLVYLFDPLQVITMVSGEDIDLLTFLTAASVDPSKPVVINMADGQILGGVASEALTITGIGAYANITLNLSGQWQGKQGLNAVRSDQNINLHIIGEVLGSTSDVAGGTTSNITIVVEATGKILAGGGNGGNGGVGGYGDNITSAWTAYRYKNTSPISLFALSSGLSCWWDDVELHNGHDDGRSYDLNIGGYVYQRGAFQVNATYSIRRATGLALGVKGSSGASGVGEGYLQSQTNGVPGGSGTNRAGGGGDGGNGGTWGIDGFTGSNGKSGLRYSTTTNSAISGGSSGLAGTSAGFSIITTGTIIYV